MKTQPVNRTPDLHPGRDGACLLLLRHGRTALNAAGVLRGRLDPPLDPIGLYEAAALGRALSGCGIGLVVSSPLLRAVQTARAIASVAGLDLEEDRRLIDRDYGQWAGKTREAVEAAYGSVDRAPDVEPVAEVRARAMEAVVELSGRVRGQTVAAVSHDAVLRLILTSLDPGLGDPDQLAQGTACVNTVNFRAGAWTVLAVNQLPADLGTSSWL